MVIVKTIVVSAAAAGAALGVQTATTPIQNELDFLWRGFLAITLALSGFYLRGLYKRLSKIDEHARQILAFSDRLIRIGGYIRALVRVLATDARQFGGRESDVLIRQLEDEMERDDELLCQKRT